MSSPKRLPQLDLLRAIAILLVLGRHIRPALIPLTGSLKPFITIWQQCGWIGVDLFFVLSGFLVSGLLLSEYQNHGTINILRFYVRRGFKIYPAFYSFLLVTILYVWFTGETLRLGAIVCEGLFIQNYGFSLWPHTWSLAVEEHFYIFLPLLLSLLLRFKNQGRPFWGLPYLFWIVAAVLLGLRLSNAFEFGYRHKTHLYPTHLRIDSLFFGVLLSYYYHFSHEWLSTSVHRWRNLIVPLSAGCLLPSIISELGSSIISYTIAFTLLFIGFGGILLTTLFSKAKWLLTSNIFTSMGAYSYSIYLWHIAVRDWVVPKAAIMTRSLPPILEVLLYLVLSIFCGILMAKIIEFPFLKIRDRLFPSRTRSALDASK